MPTEMNIKPWCNCCTTGKWLKQDGYSLDIPSGMWVHTRCRKVSRMNYERTVLGLAPIPQPTRSFDIEEFELRNDAKRDVKQELDWKKEDEDDDDSWNLEEEFPLVE